MSTPEPTSAPTPAPQAASPARKRSPIERAVVWGAILLLLGVVGVEYKTKADYSATLNKLEEDINSGNPVLLDNLQDYVKGYAVRSEEQKKDEKIVTLHWPSLFKNYTLILPVEPNNRISSFDTPDSKPEPLARVEGTPSTGPVSASTPGMGPPAGMQPPANRRPAAESDGDSEKTEKTDNPAKDDAEKPAKDDAEKPDATKSEEKANP